MLKAFSPCDPSPLLGVLTLFSWIPVWTLPPDLPFSEVFKERTVKTCCSLQ
ncbi:hypothetical protein BSU04_23740 [Caballeronia sordidicola]|uniref:Uncharacterized protein n=1 Tax=Caballeronia sordidicola TaxID=196367 RepID=A0A226WY95_CABSO|nr:hypothetical protein BSU04_23740 [Caballeronia sordidicola]